VFFVATFLCTTILLNIHGQGQGEDFSLLHSVQTGLGPTQPRTQWVHGVVPPAGKAAGAMKQITHLHLVSRSRMTELYLYSPTLCSLINHGTILPLKKLILNSTSKKPVMTGASGYVT
jgi:hypothetical protein